MTILFDGTAWGFVGLVILAAAVSGFLGGFLRGFMGAAGTDLGTWFRRRRRTITLKRWRESGQVIVEFPDQLSKDELAVLQAAIERGARYIYTQAAQDQETKP